MSRAEQRGRDGYYLSQSKVVVQQLRRGIASAGMLAPHLQKSMRDYLNLNRHHVAYRGRRRGRQSGREVLCELKEQARLRTLDGTEQPFSGLAWDRLVPPRPLEQLWGQGSKFKSCAVVTSAGAILNSSLGREIDSHEAVLRFNAAPTEGYENDVGNKTTIRIINSQILARPRHRFTTSSLYKGMTLVAWDPAPYSVDLPRWYRNPDYDLFTPYEERRRLHPTQPFYILHPKFIWQLWDVIQGNTQENIQPNPPSSGFIDYGKAKKKGIYTILNLRKYYLSHMDQKHGGESRKNNIHSCVVFPPLVLFSYDIDPVAIPGIPAGGLEGAVSS
ncbi:unnamed protein product [Oncorhynchus mykiss]|uniref:Beta-galactoside alpha-2,6-sialyltransferase 1 n=1 Tax=Oncorhynchus mykiss TaxID=8022 RepID=A0A060X4A2_ONCMY|nr:unnamed protein product [Oncorhynchus mykiss]